MATEDLLPAEYIPANLQVIQGGTERGGWSRQLTPMNQPVPKPDYLPADWEPDYAELDKPTPAVYRRVAVNENTGMILYRYAPVEFFTKRMNKAFKHQWGIEVVQEGFGTPETRIDKKTKEPYQATPYHAIVQLVAPTMFRPALGAGTSYLYSNNPQETEAKARNGAITAAFKAACKSAFGIARDVEQDDPEIAKLITDRHNTIGIVFNKLAERGKAEEAKAVIRKHAKEALLDSGELLIGAIPFESLDEIQKALNDISMAAARAAKEKPRIEEVPAKGPTE